MSVSLFVSSLIYPRQCVDEAAVAYSDFCTVVISNESSRGCHLAIGVHEAFRGSSEDGEVRVIREFLNYMLDLSLHFHLFGSNENKSNQTREGDQFSI